jgi:hypothetical protein
MKNHPFIEENINISPGNKTIKAQNKVQKIPLIRKNPNDKNDVIIDLSSNKKGKKEEDENSTNSAEFSGNILKEEKNQKKIWKTTREKSPMVLSPKAYERYNQRMKERTMRLEIEKISRETERFKKEYEEKNSYKRIFDNNPQFQKMLKSIEIQLFIIFIISIVLFIFNAIIFFKISRKKFGLSLTNLILSMGEIAIFFILIISLKLGLLNDPDLSKAFRLFVLIEFLMQITSAIINIVIGILIHEYIYKMDKIKVIFIYIIIAAIELLYLFMFKFCFILFFESSLILLNKKTEYSILMINDANLKSNDFSINEHLSTSNNLSSVKLTQTENNFINDTEQKYKMQKDDEKYRNYNYFNRFHYSVTSARNEPKYFTEKI